MSDFLRIAQEAAHGAGRLIIEHCHDKHKIENKIGFDFVTEIDQMSESFIREYISGAFPGHNFFCEEQVSGSGKDEETWLKELTGYTWVVDALDGTTNFIRGIPQFAVSIALVYQGEIIVGVVYDPTRDELFSAEKGQGAFLNGEPIHVSAREQLCDAIVSMGYPASDMTKRADTLERFAKIAMQIGSLRVFNCAAILLSYVACGRTDMTFEEGIHLWDMAAGILLIKEAGGKIAGIDGSEFTIYRKDNLAGNPALVDTFIELNK